ncbi:FMN-dependent NADH-azoreductase [Methylocapsa acidiphila]|uniref:FMN-dependent NADH-azoreductase n=1 Tax=Methylocapsa acidiphila TaxID=133552 RepID=UPI000422DC39|nr:NAD(P)H-dependent oxidoreductase [Methylocapsa acidiphila]
MKLLHIDSSILGAHSVSRPIGQAVVDRLRRERPDLAVTYRDLAAAPLPHLSPTTAPSAHPLSGAAQGADSSVIREQAESQAVLEEFLAADIVVIGAPMYNFTIPTQLKAWVDRILVPGKTFAYGAEGPKGLAGDKRAIIVASRGGLYGEAAPFAAAEHGEAYLRTVLGFIGIHDPEVIVAEGINMGPEQRDKALAEGLRSAADLRAA